MVNDLVNWLTPKRAILIIAIAAFAVYFNSLFNGFVWDDEEQIVNNIVIKSFTNLPQIFSGATFSTGGAGLSGWFFRPLLSLTYMLNFQIWQLNPFGYHLFQAIFHILNSLLLFNLLQKIHSSSKKSLLANTLATLAYSVHPMLTEGVAYIASVHYVMLSFFNLLSFNLIVARKNPILVGVTLLSGMLFNESSIIIFPVLVFYLWLYKQSLPAKAGKQESYKIWLITFTVVLVVYFFLRIILVHTPIQHPEFAPISEASILVRLQTVPLELASYLKTALYPDRLSISQHFLVEKLQFNNFYFPLILDLSFLGLTLLVSLKAHSKLSLLGLGWFLLGFGLVSNIYPLDMTVAERWMYFPFMGLALILASLFLAVLSNSKIALTGLGLIILILAGSFSRTVMRNTNWYNGLTLYSHDINLSRNSFDLENNLGVELFRASNYQDAKVHFERSIQLQPKWHFAYNNLGAVYEQEGNLTKATEYYRKTLSMSDYYLAYENLANILLISKDFKETQKFATDALKKLPNNAKLWFVLALADYQLNDMEGAKVASKNSYLIQPNEQNYNLYLQLNESK